MKTYAKLCEELKSAPKTWLVTGAGGFIGSHLVEALLRFGQHVIGLDNFYSGAAANISAIQNAVTAKEWEHFKFYQGDIRNLEDCRAAISCLSDENHTSVDYVLHQAALCSVMQSIEQPALANAINIEGFLNIMTAAREAGVKKVVYASSSAVYGDTPGSPKIESQPLQPLSPYAVTKYTDELYADIFSRIYGLDAAGLRYFNIFGSRQSPTGAYAAVIPKWIDAMMAGIPVQIHGDGETSRDFCHVGNVVQANILAACSQGEHAVYNIGTGKSTTLNQLYDTLRQNLLPHYPEIPEHAVYTGARAGDIRTSLADIGKAIRELGYHPDDNLDIQLQALTKSYLSSN